jgi:hypothetical protein
LGRDGETIVMAAPIELPLRQLSVGVSRSMAKQY